MNTEKTLAGSVVAAYDGSDHAEFALRWAAAEAQLEGRPLTVVYAVRPPSGYELSALTGTGLLPEELKQAMRAEAHRLVESVVERLRSETPRIEVEGLVLTGDPREVLVRLSHDASSLFLGSRGRGLVASLLLGSVSVAVSREAACPTFVIRPHHPGRVRNGVLVGTDCTEQTRGTVEFAFRQASLRRLPLTVLHCVGTSGVPAGAATVLDDEADGYAEDRLELAEAVAGLREKFPDVPVRLRVARGVADACLVAQSDQMDLLVLGHHHGPAAGDLVRLGSFVTSVVESAGCPVAVVTDGGSAPSRRD